MFKLTKVAFCVAVAAAVSAYKGRRGSGARDERETGNIQDRHKRETRERQERDKREARERQDRLNQALNFS